MKSKPILSIIIPCFNLSHFLADAIKSCMLIPISKKEIIVIDDGSSDETGKIAQSFPSVTYFYQENKGLPVARNAGLALATGEYICFLDADDWLLPKNILESVSLLQQNSEADVIFGRHFIQKENGDLQLHQPEIKQPIYTQLLQSNIIGNPSTVLYRRNVVNDYPFSTDLSFKGCEDYHQYLRIARNTSILYHNLPVAIYRRHPSNMSSNLAMMLDSVLNVLYDQQSKLHSTEELLAWKKGMNDWLRYYSFFPLRENEKIHLNRYHWNLVKKLRWKLPRIILNKCISRI